MNSPGSIFLRCATFFAVMFVTSLGSSHGSETPTVHNTRLVYSTEEMVNLELDRFIERSAPHLAPYRETLSHWSAASTISPKVTLTLIEMQSGMVSEPRALGPTDHDPRDDSSRPLGSLVAPAGFSNQLRGGLDQLSNLFYGYQPASTTNLSPASPHDRPADAASAALRALLVSQEALARFVATYADLFPNASALSQPTPGAHFHTKAAAPAPNYLQLPYSIGLGWIFNGAHSYRGNNEGPPSSLDFSRNWPTWGANTSNDWVVAAHGGQVIVHSSCFIQVLGSDGWSTTYYHLDNIVVANGQTVQGNQRLANYANNQAQALCGGGSSTGPHVHFSLRRNGEYASLDGVALSGWVVHPGTVDYHADCNFFWLERNGSRVCAWSRLINLGLPTLSPPAAPSGLGARNLGNQRVELTWNDNSDDESNFEIQRLVGGFVTIATVEANSTRYIESNLAQGTTYTYRVRANNAAGSSTWTNTATATTNGLGAPSDLDAIPRSESVVEVSWSDNSTTETIFEIEARTTGAYRLVATAAANSTNAEISELEPQTTYTFRVRATSSVGNSAYSNAATATTFQGDPEPCVEDEATMCLNEGRFKVQVTWQDFNEQTGSAQRVASGATDSGLFWFFDDGNWEMLIKVLDGCAVNDHFWVFAAATTDVEYTLRVTDSFTGVVASVFNRLGNASSATTNTEAFATCQVTPPPWATTPQPLGGREIAPVPPVAQAKTKAVEGCGDDADHLCLNRERFEIEVEWEDFAGQTGRGQVVPFGTADSGLFWFFSDANWEMLVKVLDGCALNEHYWVFSAATTNVSYTLRVRDTLTGAVVEYDNPLGVAANAITDTNAFATCP